MLLNRARLRLISVAGSLLVAEVLTFYWLGQATTTWNLLNRVLFFTAPYILPGLLLRIIFYSTVFRWALQRKKHSRSRGWAFLMILPASWFIYRMFDSSSNLATLESRWPYFTLYVVVEGFICLAAVEVLAIYSKCNSNCEVN